MDYEIKVIFLAFDRINVTEDFIKNNKLTLTRTQEEILDKINNSDRFFKFDREVFIDYLSYENAKSFYSDEYNLKIANKELEQPLAITDIKETIQDFLDYMVFAWGKAIDERGISASRSISKLAAWLWLLGREDLEDSINRDDLYEPYGMPALIEVCNMLNINVPNKCYDFVDNFKGN